MFRSIRLVFSVSVLFCLAFAFVGCEEKKKKAIPLSLSGRGGSGGQAGATGGGQTGSGQRSAPKTPPGDRTAPLTAGVARVDITPPVGVPLAGYGEGDRRLKWPDLNPLNYNTFFAPSTGVADPIWAKALVLSDGTDTVCILTLDGVATAGHVVEDVAKQLKLAGVSISKEQILVCSSHSHSGPGTLSKKRFWQFVAVDLFVQSVYDDFVSGTAQAVIQASRNMVPARLGVGMGTVSGFSKNRRHKDSPDLDPGDVDPELGVIRIDRANGKPLAVVWNFAVHGLGYWWDNMEFSADITGATSDAVEAALPGAIALYANGAEGDINPVGGHGHLAVLDWGQRMGAEVLKVHAGIAATTDDVEVENATEVVDFGNAVLDFRMNRLGASNSLGGQMKLLKWLSSQGLSPGASISLDEKWLPRKFRFQAIRLNETVIASIPGEAVHRLGQAIKDYGRKKGYTHSFAFGLANGHMAYIAWPEKEYWYGGYEGLATFYGPKTGDKVLNAAKRMIDALPK